jgi:PKD domain
MNPRQTRRIGSALVAAVAAVVAAVASLAAPDASFAQLTASFTASPNPAMVGETVTFDGSASMAGGEDSITSFEWDLDGDQEFETHTGTTPTVSHVYDDPGTVPVSLRVSDGVDSSEATLNLEVQAPQPPPPEPTAHELLSPFPIVRLAGQVRGGFTRIDVLSVRAPAGSHVTVRCRGRTCPFAQRSRTVEGRRVRFHGIEVRLRRGVVIRIFVTKAEKVGKFTRFRIRGGKVPKRRDRCVAVGSLQPISCPES